MSESKMTNKQMLNYYKSQSPKQLIHLFEGLSTKLWELGDIRENSAFMFKPEVMPIVEDTVMEGYRDILEEMAAAYEGETMLVENYDDADDISGTVQEMAQVHENNLRQLMENSAAEVRTANANQFNLNQLTPFDAFLPFTIVRSYLPLVGKDLIPTQTPSQPFIRIKQQYKYVVTKDNKKYLRPDVYNNPSEVADILATAKGKRVTEKWYPAGVEATEDQYDYEEDGMFMNAPEAGLKIAGLDLLGESGGVIAVGDDLDIDVCVNAIRAVVTNSEGTQQTITQEGYAAYPDLTSISPQRSISFKVKLPVTDASGKVEKYVEDVIYGDYNDATNTFNLISLYGYVRQVQFDGHLSNKNNYEYLSFTHEFGVVQHPIPEGYKSNVPITVEDMQLYNQTASIDIVATAINEMTEIFTQMEDTSIIHKIDTEYDRWNGKEDHPFEHMFGPVVFNKTVSVAHDTSRLLKRNQYVQDEIQYAVSRFIGDMRNTLVAEPFRLVAFAHPNICSLFVGDNVDWKITPGASGTDGIRTDYRMGVYTAQGDSFRIISSMKIAEEDGVRFLIYPVNEQNFLSWKHFKYSMYFSRDYRNPQMDLVPNVMGMSRFYTHSYTPLQAKLFIRDYK